MSAYPITSVDWFYLATNFLIAVLCFSQSWVNIIHKRVSTFSIDTFAFWLAISFGGEQTKRRAQEYKKNSKRILLLGLSTLLLASGCTYNLIQWFATNL